MVQWYRHLLRLYPPHVRIIYGAEMLSGFTERARSADSRIRKMRLLLRDVATVLPDAAAERIATFSSHPSFHGARPPDLGVVRPPNVSKREWFGGDESSARGR